MICEECKSCWNYMVCENGCYGSDKPCEYFVSDTDNNILEDKMDEQLKLLACFGCPYVDECKDEWEEGHSHCDEMMEKAKAFVKRTGINPQN